MAALWSRGFSRLISASRNSNICRVRKLIRRPLPGSPSSEPGTIRGDLMLEDHHVVRHVTMQNVLLAAEVRG